MNLKIKALIGTLKILAIGIILYATGHEIAKQFTVEEISIGISTIGTLFCLYLIFDLKLSQLKIEEQLNKNIKE